MAVNFPGSPINGQQFTANGITYEWNSALSLWEISLVTIPADVSELGDSQGLLSGGGSTGEGITAYTNTGDLPMTGVNTGAMAFVTSTNSLYIWNGSTWYGLSVVANSSPSLSGASPSYTLATDGTATVVTLTGTDTDGTPLTYSYSVTSGSLTNGGGETATVTQNGNVFTITPTTTDTYAGTFELTFTVSDGEASATASSSFTLKFAIPQQANTQGNTLLLTTSGSAGDNSAFTDSSPNALTITTAGTPSSQSFSPYRSGGYSLQLDGNDYITTGFNDNFGTGDFTFECWAKTTVGGVIMCQYDNGSQAEAFEIGTGDGIIRSHTDTGTEGAQGSQDLRDNKWHHLVWERHSGTYYYYVDGSLQASNPNSENGQQTTGWYIGRFGVANTGYFTGEIRDLKFTVGTAVYGGSAPSVPTELTLSGSETFVFATGLPYAKDVSTNGTSRTITNYGDPKYIPEGPYDYAVYDSATHGGSVYLDGSGDYLAAEHNGNFNFGTGDFTIDFWYYPTAHKNWSELFDTRNSEYTAGAIAIYTNASGTIYFYNSNGSSGTNAITGGPLILNVWSHIEVSRSSGSTKMFINGKQSGSTYTDGNDYTCPAITPKIGTDQSGQYSATGYISDFRLLNGTAAHTTDFTPPTEPTSSSGAAFHLVGTDANIYDSSQTVKPVILVGSGTTASTNQTKYLSSSMYFDGSGDYLSVGSGSQFDFGTEDFTWEAWAYPNASNRSQQIFSVGDTNSTVVGFYYRSTNKFAFYANSTLYLESASTYSTGQWYHVAVVRSGNDFTLYVNGTSVSTSTQTASIGSSSEGAYVGTNYGLTPNQDWNGYIEDVRITKGLARYTEDFTVPTESLLTYTPPPAAAGSSTFENSADGELTFTGDYEFAFSSSGAEATGGASTTAGLENGKKYFEVDLTGISDAAIGLYPVSVTNPGLTVAGGVSIDETTGDIYPGPVDENLTITNASVLQFAYDATEQKVWLGVDGTWTTATGDPASGAGISTSGGRGETYALTFMSTSGLSSGSATGNIRTSGNLNYTVPTGFTAFADAAGDWTVDLSNVTYDNVSYDVSGNDTVPMGLAFSTDGTRMFISGDQNGKVYQYELSTGFDLSTASHNNVEFSVLNEDGVPICVEFNTDGTKMYVMGSAGDTIFEYDLTTGWDLSTASYNQVSLNVTTQDTKPRGIAFNADGTKMIISGSTTDSLHQYTLTNGFDLSTASYDNVSFSVATEDITPMDITFNSDGTKLYMVGYDSGKVFQYSLSTAYDISTASYDSKELNLNGQDSLPRGLSFSNDGTKLFMVGQANDNVHQYSTVSSAPAVSAASYGDRGIIMGGYTNGSRVNTIQYFDITNSGNASNFGDLTSIRSGGGCVSNTTIAMNGGGYSTENLKSIDYITIATPGNAADAGDLTYSRNALGAFSNGTRGVFCGGQISSNDNTVDYVTIATSVTAADFGDSLVAIRLYATASDNTYGIQAGGYTTTMINTIQYYTIDTADNATAFGNLTNNYYDKQGVYDLTYSVFAGGSPSTATIDYITTATTGNASDFGDLLFANRFWSGSGCSNGTLGVFCGGGQNSDGLNDMQYITVSTPSNATDFGDMTTPLIHPGCTSGNAS